VVTRSPADILKNVAEIGGFEVEDLVGPGHTRRASLLRRAAIELLRSDAGLPFAQIAKIFGRSRQWAYYLSASPETADPDTGLMMWWWKPAVGSTPAARAAGLAPTTVKLSERKGRADGFRTLRHTG